ncbi:hypothetical protein AYI69_g7786 [Smittium culicis]|uniref:SET domain-containing protein n=1 Tax=Smittium culicis TaxID=133412 RepID=A0A1R1XPM9_9FUNG|nr:hypothetical protein AYI69_g7786 [Smittium culicis]
MPTCEVYNNIECKTNKSTQDISKKLPKTSLLHNNELYQIEIDQNLISNNKSILIRQSKSSKKSIKILKSEITNKNFPNSLNSIDIPENCPENTYKSNTDVYIEIEPISFRASEFTYFHKSNTTEYCNYTEKHQSQSIQDDILNSSSKNIDSSITPSKEPSTQKTFTVFETKHDSISFFDNKSHSHNLEKQKHFEDMSLVSIPKTSPDMQSHNFDISSTDSCSDNEIQTRPISGTSSTHTLLESDSIDFLTDVDCSLELEKSKNQPVSLLAPKSNIEITDSSSVTFYENEDENEHENKIESFIDDAKKITINSENQSFGLASNKLKDRPRWYNQAYVLFLTLRQAENYTLEKLALIEKAMLLDKKLSLDLGVKRAFEGSKLNIYKSAKLVLASNDENTFVKIKSKDSKKHLYTLAYKPGDFNSAAKSYQHWMEILINQDWPKCFNGDKANLKTKSLHDDFLESFDPDSQFYYNQNHESDHVEYSKTLSDSSIGRKSFFSVKKISLVFKARIRIEGSRVYIENDSGYKCASSLTSISGDTPISSTNHINRISLNDKTPKISRASNPYVLIENKVSSSSVPTNSNFLYYDSYMNQIKDPLSDTISSLDRSIKPASIQNSLIPALGNSGHFLNALEKDITQNQSHGLIGCLDCSLVDTHTHSCPNINSSGLTTKNNSCSFILGNSSFYEKLPVPTKLSDIVQVRKSTAPNSGDGLFATRFLPKGIPIGFYFGVPMTEDEFDSLKDRVGISSRYSIMYLKTVLDATDDNGYPYRDQNGPIFCPFHFMNEDRENNNFNIVFDEGSVVNQVICYTIRDIQEGEELFVHYGFEVDRES